MMPEIGNGLLCLALGIALLLSVYPLWGVARGDARMMASSRLFAWLLFMSVAGAFLVLVNAFVVNDFTVTYVASNSNTQLPVWYRVAATWGAHEGSLLLWVLLMSGWTFAVAIFSQRIPLDIVARVLAIMGMVSVGFLLFILFTSNPFSRTLPNFPIEGRDLNPLLQDPGLIFHPPLLYMGYVGFSVAFAFAIASLLCGRLDSTYARFTRPWTLAAWIFLTLGIVLGSAWAYYELGWGGWWFWDPVENASLMPWIAGTALLHSAVVMEKRNALKVWTILLSILTFSLSLLGTFLVRSGVLTSVHTFASDPARGVFILAILVFFIGGSLALYAWRAPLLKQGGIFAPISREGALVLNNLLLTTALATVFVGTLYPLALEALTGAKISVGAPFFNATFGPLIVPLLLAVPFGPLLAWKRGDLLGAAQRLMAAFAAGLVAIAATFAVVQGGPVLAPFAIGLAVYVMVGALTDLAERAQLFRVPVTTSLRRLRGLPRSAFGTALAHFGLGVCLLGIAGEASYNAERILAMKPGQSVAIRDYNVAFDGLVSRQGPNYRELVAKFVVRQNGEVIGTLEPSKRSFTTRGMSTSEAALLTRGFSQIYMSLGDPAADGTISVRLYHKPLVLLIWIGCVIMVLGGALSLSDRRLRVGAPKPAKKSAMQPAE